MKKEILFLLLIPSLLFPQRDIHNKIYIKGKWQFTVDSLDLGIKGKWYNNNFQGTINLPGSMTENGKGNPVSLSTKWTGDILDSSFFKEPQYENFRKPGNFKVPFWLQPDKYYKGAAWYRKKITIPRNWNDKSIELYLERVHWQSSVWVDSLFIGSQNGLGAPHIFDLTGILSPGVHFITIRIDNRINDINPGVNSSSLTDHSQTNWNGIIGEMSVRAQDKIFFKYIRIFTDIYSKKAAVEMHITNLFDSNKRAAIFINAIPQGKTRRPLSSKLINQKFEFKPGDTTVTIPYEIKDALLWDEFNPSLYKITCTISAGNFNKKKEVIFGFRKLEVKGTRFTLNDRPIFLRGTLECAVFPKTGYPPTSIKEWERIFKVCKNYGLNHMRFHSWCPPEAAFAAADNLGMYLYVECSSWANQGPTLGDGKPIDKYIFDESERIVKAFGNHPSFCFLAYGNEPAGENQNTFLTKFVKFWKEKDNRRLYTAASGWPALDVNDFHSMYEPRIQLWGAGLNSIINSKHPGSDYDWIDIIDKKNKPVISHEIGQWCVYPDFKETKKYNGVLKAKNFEIFKQMLADNGLSNLADSFLIASGKLQVLCYKAEIEAALRTKNLGGFQLLDLHDFPGQGTALVGVLNPFWENKGYVTSNEYRQFCNTVVPLARLSKFVFNTDENFNASVVASNFSENELKSVSPTWKIIDQDNKIVLKGMLNKTDIPIGNGIELGNIHLTLSGLKAPSMYSLLIEIAGYNNKWDFWVYPNAKKETNQLKNNTIKIVKELDEESIRFLTNGGKVLLTPTKGSINKDKGGSIVVGFSSIFWNTAWTSKQPPHTLGILCNPRHPLFNEYPTQYYCNYQWWDAMSNSNAILLKELGNNIQPIVRVIDDWFTARSLGLIIEAKIGKGKLILTGIDLLTNTEKRPEAQQLLKSILKYMDGNSFNPRQEIEIQKLQNLFGKN